MSLWTFSAYHLEGGTCPIRDWYANQDARVQAAFDATLAVLSATEDWENADEFGVLKRDHAGLGEIRFYLEDRTGRRGARPPIRRFRPVGIWPPISEGTFILLLGCEKFRGVLCPENAFDLALRYKRDLEAGIGKVYEYL